MTLPTAFLDEVRSRTLLSALIGKTVKITRAGREWKACCPFHNEKTPSFTINDDKGFYHCFGCGAHGDAIRWMTDQCGLPFIDAVKELAADAGLSMPERSPEAAARAARIDGIRPALEAAGAYYRAELSKFGARSSPSPTQQRSGADAGAWAVTGPMAYLAARGIGPDMIARFALGWAPEGRDHVRTIPGMTFDLARDAGLIWHDPETGRDGSSFRARVMIPVHDGRGRIVGFAGRSIDGAEPKYKNSPASEMFDKSRILFNAHRAQERLREARGNLFIVEGQIDAMMLDMDGLAAVAPMGTALTAEHLAAAWRMDPQPVLLFDGDAAGERAARRACELALPLMTAATGLRIATLSPGDDPDTVVRRDGAGTIMDLAFQAQPIDRWLFWHVARGIDRGDVAAVTAAAHELSDLAGRITDPMLQREMEATWQVRHLRELSAAGVMMRVVPDDGPHGVVHGVATPDKSAADAGATLAVADDEGEQRLRDIIRSLLDDRAARAEINQDIRDKMAVAKALGYAPKAINAVLRDMEADLASREDFEVMWALYRRVAGVSGPIFEGVLPATADRRERAATIAGKRMRRIHAEIDMPKLAAPVYGRGRPDGDAAPVTRRGSAA